MVRPAAGLMFAKLGDEELRKANEEADPEIERLNQVLRDLDRVLHHAQEGADRRETRSRLPRGV